MCKVIFTIPSLSLPWKLTIFQLGFETFGKELLFLFKVNGKCKSLVLYWWPFPPWKELWISFLGVTLERICSIVLWDINVFSNQSFIDLWILQMTIIWLLMKMNFFTHPYVYKMVPKVKNLGNELGFVMECSRSFILQC